MFAGKVGRGFNPHTRRELLKAMKLLATPRCGFANLPSSKNRSLGRRHDRRTDGRNPMAEAQIKFTEWTRGGHLRHADCLGFRLDKNGTGGGPSGARGLRLRS